MANDQPALLPALPVISLVAGDKPVQAPPGIVFSTAPTSWVSEDGVSYVVKGPEMPVVVGEAVAYQLARDVGLAVPDFALARAADRPGIYFACRKLLVLRDISTSLRHQREATLAAIARTVVFDVWIANPDRNYLNVLPPTDGAWTAGIRTAVAIDFEKAVAIRAREALIESSAMDPRRLWPTDELGATLVGTALPRDMVDRIAATRQDRLERAVQSVSNIVGDGFDWGDSVVSALSHRLRNLGQLTQEAWR